MTTGQSTGGAIQMDTMHAPILRSRSCVSDFDLYQSFSALWPDLENAMCLCDVILVVEG